MGVGVGRARGDEKIDRRRFPCPDAAAGRRRAGRWCRARPRRPRRSPCSTGAPSRQHALAVALHLQLLEIGGKAREALVVGDHGLRGVAEDVAVPDAEEPHQHRDVLVERRLAEVLVDVVAAAQEFLEQLGADGDRRAAGRCSTRSNSARRPSPRSRTRGWRRRRIRRPCRAASRRRRNGRRPRLRRAHGRSRRGRLCALVIVSWVVKVFEETMNRVRAGSRPRSVSRDVGAVDVGDEMGAQVRRREGQKRPRRHRRAEIRAADADIDDVGHRLAERAAQAALAHVGGEGEHLGALGLDFGHDVAAVDEDRLAGEIAQGGVQRRAPFRRIDDLAAEHRVALGLDLGAPRRAATSSASAAASMRCLEKS